MYTSAMDRRIAVRGIIIDDGKLLCLRLKPYRHKDASTYWCTPGGGVDVGEALVPALEREIHEELGIHPVVGNLLYVQQFIHKDIEQMEFFFLITNGEDYLHVDLAATTHGKDEIEEVSFLNPAGEHVLPEFLQSEKFDNLENQATKFFNYL